MCLCVLASEKTKLKLFNVAPANPSLSLTVLPTTQKESDAH